MVCEYSKNCPRVCRCHNCSLTPLCRRNCTCILERDSIEHCYRWDCGCQKCKSRCQCMSCIDWKAKKRRAKLRQREKKPVTLIEPSFSEDSELLEEERREKLRVECYWKSVKLVDDFLAGKVDPRFQKVLEEQTKGLLLEKERANEVKEAHERAVRRVQLEIENANQEIINEARLKAEQHQKSDDAFSLQYVPETKKFQDLKKTSPVKEQELLAGAMKGPSGFIARPPVDYDVTALSLDLTDTGSTFMETRKKMYDKSNHEGRFVDSTEFDDNYSISMTNKSYRI